MPDSASNTMARDAFMRELRLDHARLSRVLREIDLQQAVLQSNAESARAVLLEAIRYLIHYQDGVHHAREDYFFERILQRLPHLEADVRRLLREHVEVRRIDAQLAADLASASVPALEGNHGWVLARRLRAHVAHARAHIRREEDVFYRRAEEELAPSDWAELMRQVSQDETLASVEDPLASPQRMYAAYPLLARRLEAGVNEVAGPGDRPARETSLATLRLQAALRVLFEQSIEVSGRWTLDVIALAQANMRSMQRIYTPLDLWSVSQEIGLRNSGFALHFLVDTPRWASQTWSGVWEELSAGKPDSAQH